MAVSHRYKNFADAKQTSPDKLNSNSEAVEDQKLQAFEAGYQAGWDDATKAQTDEKERITAELGQNLIDMKFTYQEALSELTVSIEPVMKAIVEKLFPEAMRAALSAHILDQVASMVDAKTDRSIEVVVSTGNVERVTNLIGSTSEQPMNVIAEPTLADGQAFVRLGETERQIDLNSLMEGVSKAIEAFFHEAHRESDNG
ncbi:ABC transporter ATP-binding protein [Roseobacter denitrificans]|uniref:ABC transporter, ATP-binding n=1 Tax=Roseobacter denitrificans (strain ATCC 33942 / OCh 114) TaxID=375451 RepID=Q16DF0_ROSDO|nr:hypothetical protein [Roseobacter denitrificans]ABG29993.1 ABC transporter, ATP-binding [Roseobacter denitrificans OCh 114]AVL53199.1 ABC transporter ATP-binding protein [Roseobacter denitrificans]SFF68537.1 flagellar assembly protein FliH [Roseobacter denitrificans OCh 114]